MKSSYVQLRIRRRKSEYDQKRPGETISELFTKSVPISVIRGTFAEASSTAKLSLVVSTFAEILRGSYWVRNVSYDDVLNWHRSVDSDFKLSARNEQIDQLIKTAQTLDQRNDKFAQQIPINTMQFDHVPVLQ